MTGAGTAASGQDGTSNGTEPVGSVAEEAFKLFRAVTSTPTGEDESTGSHVCTTTWCPVCQVVGFVRDNPEALATVSQSATALVRSVRDLFESAAPPQEET